MKSATARSAVRATARVTGDVLEIIDWAEASKPFDPLWWETVRRKSADTNPFASTPDVSVDRIKFSENIVRRKPVPQPYAETVNQPRASDKRGFQGHEACP